MVNLRFISLLAQAITLSLRVTCVPPSHRALELEELEQVALRVLERGDPEAVLLVRLFDELDAGALEAGAIGLDIVRVEADDVAGRGPPPSLEPPVGNPAPRPPRWGG